MNHVLRNREMSGFPVSIATGLALETLFSPVQETNNEGRSDYKLDDLNKYDVYAINLTTLVRNILGSVSTSEAKRLSGRDVLECLFDEVKMLRLLFDEHNIKLEIYICSYEDLFKRYQEDIKWPTTPKQLHEDKIMKFCKKEMSKDPLIKKFDSRIYFGKGFKCLMISHVPADLLSQDKFMRLDLLESHTGKIKSRDEFNTKLTKFGDMDMSWIPFFEYTLTTFGDKVMFKHASTPLRKKVYEDLKKLKANPMSSEMDLVKSLGKNL